MTAGTQLNLLKIILAENWAINVVDLELLGGEVDQTFRVLDTAGTTFCVKLRRGSSMGLELELAAVTHLGEKADMVVPGIISTIDKASHWTGPDGAVWVLEWLGGMRWSDLPYRSQALARDLGERARQLADALADFEHDAAHRTHHWDLRCLTSSIERHRSEAATDSQRRSIERTCEMLSEVEPRLAGLPHSVVHQDLNDHNVLVKSVDGKSSISGIVDFGDLLHSATITELAVAVAYSMLRSEQPIDTATEVVAGWFGQGAPQDHELEVIFPLALGRLAVNALTWSARRADQPDYAEARSKHTWATIDQLVRLPAAFVAERFRSACELSPHPTELVVRTSGNGGDPLAYQSCSVIDLDPHCDLFDRVDPTDAAAVRVAAVPDPPFAIAHNTIRLDRGGRADGFGGPATVQLGAELHLGTGVFIQAPTAGQVVEVSDTRVVVAHDPGGTRWWSVWSGLSASVIEGEYIERGDEIGTGQSAEDGVNVQLVRFAPKPGDLIPRFVRPRDRSAWTALSVDPGSFLGLPEREQPAPLKSQKITDLRNDRLASSQRYYYQEPMSLVRSRGVVLVDSDGHHYLDAINNVTHVGHANQRVVEAAERQLRRLNTNSRFVYEQMGSYADRLARLLPDPLGVVFLVCTGSEANDLALRIARQITGNTDIMVVDGAYHGNTTTVTGISPNRYKGTGGDGPPPTTHEVARPDRYRGEFGYDDLDAGSNYAASVRDVARRLVAKGRPPAAFIAESLMGTAGQVVYPPGYLIESFEAVRAAGGLCISDEVQVGFGRLGTHFWGFEQGGVVPDIVTMGKPMGNGHPVAAVVTTRSIADEFDRGMKYFNTFGGNPVSCAIANAVLDEVEQRGLQQHALVTGKRFLERLAELKQRHLQIGDVRGEGLYLGVEFVQDRTTKEPNPLLTAEICERMRQHGVVVYPNGVFGNCLKIKPPMPFNDDDTDCFVEALEVVIGELCSSGVSPG